MYLESTDYTCPYCYHKLEDVSSSTKACKNCNKIFLTEEVKEICLVDQWQDGQHLN